MFVEGSGSEAVTYTWHGSSEISPLQSGGCRDLINFVLYEYFPNRFILFVNSSYLPRQPSSNMRGTTRENSTIANTDKKNRLVCYSAKNFTVLRSLLENYSL